MNTKAIQLAIFRAKMALKGFEVATSSKGAIYGIKRGVKRVKNANNANFKTNFSA
ncbi:hypothetical protein CDOMF_0956 [Campylobacter sp. RM16187]|nr:hypothetical protein CDOMF_0956 [Campylobacter sp. RM16187]